ncbi:S-layer homology domain-containing protein [Bacillus sp. 1P06AnD]|uniref:S-layer homology domain-containing protein n=1 Tax=Bacillus sp. 1P06AnD TaxID=3132208 RepID=UPI00399FE2DE
MAYQPKSYRKFVATAATATLVASAVAPLASAATSFQDVNVNYQKAVDFVASKGIQGFSDKEFGVYKNIKRGDAAVMLVKVLGLDTEKAPASGFKDVPTRAVKEVNALKAAGITSGKTETEFAFDQNITRGELAIWIQKGFSLKAKDDKEIPFKDVNKNYTTAVKALVDNGVTKGKTETTFGTDANATRGDYAQFLYRAANPVVEKVAIASATAVNAKTVEVKFNKAIDASKAKFEVKKGTATVNVAKITPAADNKSVQLELASKFFEGEYTVNVTGLSEEKLSGSVKVENEKVSKIELLSENAPKTGTSTATVGYRVLNQYGEDITKSPLAASIAWNTPSGFSADDNNAGVLTVTKADGADLKVGDKVVVTGINASTNSVVSGTLSVTNAAVADTITFKEVYNADGKELAGNSTVSDFKLLIDAKDQYGNPINAAKVNSDILFTSSNESLVKVTTAADGQGKDKNQVGLNLAFGDNAANGGKAVITAISKSTGKVTQYELTVKAAPKLDTFTMTAPADVIAAGDTVKIPFVAADQFGTAITKAKDLKDQVAFSGTYGEQNSLQIKGDVNGNAYLEYKPASKGTKIIIAAFNGKVSQLNLNVVDSANPVSIDPLKDVTTSVAKDGTLSIGLKNIVVKDEYGRTVSLKDKLATTAADGKYRIVASDAQATDGAIQVVNEKIDSEDAKIVLKGLAKGSEDVTFTLQQSKKQSGNTYTFEDVATSPLKVAFTTVEKAAFDSYEVGKVDPLYADGTATTHTRDLKVYGVKADGSKVLLPSSYYTVITNTDVLVNNSGKLNAVYANDNTAFGTKDEITTKLTVVVDGAEKPTTLTQDVVISKVAPKADKIEFTDAVENGLATISSTDLTATNDAAKLSTILEVTDQYGVAIASPQPIITVTNLVDRSEPKTLDVANNGTKAVDIKNANAEDTFTVTYLLDGKSETVKFKVVTPEQN